jgi:hypothetical protein
VDEAVCCEGERIARVAPSLHGTPRA